MFGTVELIFNTAEHRFLRSLKTFIHCFHSRLTSCCIVRKEYNNIGTGSHANLLEVLSSEDLPKAYCSHQLIDFCCTFTATNNFK